MCRLGGGGQRDFYRRRWTSSGLFSGRLCAAGQRAKKSCLDTPDRGRKHPARIQRTGGKFSAGTQRMSGRIFHLDAEDGWKNFSARMQREDGRIFYPYGAGGRKKILPDLGGQGTEYSTQLHRAGSERRSSTAPGRKRTPQIGYAGWGREPPAADEGGGG